MSKIKLLLDVVEDARAVADCCTNLTTVILRNASQVCALGDINVFDSTALAQVFVPAAMVDAYKADSRWSKHASKILAIEDYPDITGG